MSKKNGMSYSQRKRAKLDYRREYFKHNPGLFGNIWFCSQCGRPLVGKQNVEVDHIIPLNSIAGQNKRYNLVAICSTCNKHKSDNGGMYIVKGGIAKIFEVILFSAQKIIIIAIAGCIYVIRAVLMCIVNLLKAPFIYLQGTQQIIAYIMIFIVIMWLLNQ